MGLGRTKLGGTPSVDPRPQMRRLAGVAGKRRLQQSNRALAIGGLNGFCHDKGLNPQALMRVIPKNTEPLKWIHRNYPDVLKVAGMFPTRTLTDAFKLLADYQAHWPWLRRIFSVVEFAQGPIGAKTIWDTFTATIYQRYLIFEIIRGGNKSNTYDAAIQAEYQQHGQWLFKIYSSANIQEKGLVLKPWQQRLTTRSRFESEIDARVKAFQTMEDHGIRLTDRPK